MGFRCRCDSGRVVLCMKARLEFPYPITTGGRGQAGILSQMLLEPALIELRVVKGAELWSQAAKGSNQSKSHGNVVGSKLKPHLSSELEPVFGLSLHLLERISASEKVGNHVTRAKSRIREIAAFFSGVESTSVPDAAIAQMPSPRSNVMAKGIVDATFKTVQSAFLSEIDGELAKPESRSVLPQLRTQDRAKQGVGVTRCVTVAVFKAKVYHVGADKVMQIFVGVPGWCGQYRKDVKRCSAIGISHQRQLNKLLNRLRVELAPDLRVFPFYFFLRRVRRPVDANAPEIFEAHLDSTIAPIQGHVKFGAQARNGGTVDGVPRTLRQHR